MSIVDKTLDLVLNHYDTPEVYLELWNGIKKDFGDRVDKYYQKYVLDLPTFKERWAAYLATPNEWLVHEPYVVHYYAIDSIDTTIDIGDYIFDKHYGEKGQVITNEDFAVWFNEDLEEENIERGVIHQWQEQLINNRIGSITLDW